MATVSSARSPRPSAIDDEKALIVERPAGSPFDGELEGSAPGGTGARGRDTAGDDLAGRVGHPPLHGSLVHRSLAPKGQRLVCSDRHGAGDRVRRLGDPDALPRQELLGRGGASSHGGVEGGGDSVARGERRIAGAHPVPAQAEPRVRAAGGVARDGEDRQADVPSNAIGVGGACTDAGGRRGGVGRSKAGTCDEHGDGDRKDRCGSQQHRRPAARCGGAGRRRGRVRTGS
jgi:hypothetical protein